MAGLLKLKWGNNIKIQLKFRFHANWDFSDKLCSPFKGELKLRGKFSLLWEEVRHLNTKPLSLFIQKLVVFCLLFFICCEGIIKLRGENMQFNG